ncbi:mRNA-degrading endonuclease RelE of RelBE toxin-antitoxin system [Providencia alcalifaciens]|nr:mRNA-degrading endonuclease RelE of RelBE toxin-antitoxin system [Providencia alcalifaciens]
MALVEWSEKAKHQMFSIDTRYRKAIYSKVEQLEQFPNVRLDIKKLQAVKGKYRLRVGNYRVIFEVTNGEPIICEILTVARRTSTTYKGS